VRWAGAEHLARVRHAVVQQPWRSAPGGYSNGGSASPSGFCDFHRMISIGVLTPHATAGLRDDAEAVFIGGTGLRAARAIEALEERLDAPCSSTDQPSIALHGSS
jgi:hypothetical protein